MVTGGGQGEGDGRRGPCTELKRSSRPSGAQNQKVNGWPRGAGPQGPFDLSWQQSTAAQKHEGTLKALLRRNHLVSLEEMTEKTQLWKNKAEHSILSVV